MRSVATYGIKHAQNKLPRAAWIYTAESTAIDLALNIIKNSWSSKFMICTDSKFLTEALKNENMNNLLIIPLCNRFHKLFNMKTIVFWILSQVGICGNKKVDQLPKNHYTVSKQIPKFHTQIWNQQLIGS